LAQAFPAQIQTMASRALSSVLAVLFALAAWWHLGAQQHDVGFVGNAASKPKAAGSLTSLSAVDKALKNRMTSVQKTSKLTDAMRLVAAAKIRKAQDGVAKARPFSDELQSMIKGLVKRLKGSGLEAELPMLRVPEKVNNVCILVVSSNKGLCGAYNAFVAKKATARVEELNKQGIAPKIIFIGRKGRLGFNSRAARMDWNFTAFYDSPKEVTAAYSSEIAEALKNIFLSGEVDKVEIVYGKFINLLTTEPAVRTILPLSPTGIEDPEDETFTLTSEDGQFKAEKQKVKAAKAKDIENDVIFDQPPEVILNSMLPLYLNSQLLSVFFDSAASELSSRMTAMKAATDNARALGKKLTLIYNKKRQAQITAEISEISAAAAALAATDNSLTGEKFNPDEPASGVLPDFMKELQG